MRFLATTQLPKAVLDKYRSKLHEKASREGHETIDDLKAAYSSKIEEQRLKDVIKLPSALAQSVPGAEAELVIPQTEGTPVAQANRGPLPSQIDAATSKTKPSSGSKQPAVKSLNDILDLEKAADLPEKELTAIWRLRHASSPQMLCATISASTYQAMEDAARNAPQFVLPVPHETQGAELHFLQWTFDAESKTSTVLFTQLAEYKNRGEFAQPHTTITHHLDFAGDKGLVLMQGQVVDGRGVQPEHAKWLVLCLQRFYGGWESDAAPLDGERKARAEERKNLLQWFSKGDARFSVEKLMEEAERMG